MDACEPLETLAKEDEGNTKKRKTWKRSFDYLFAICGLMIGLGNIWRFPYLCYKNGGGAFLVAYVVVVTIMIFPLIVLESSLGQLTGRSAAKAWNLVPIFKGIGYALVVLMFFCNMFYPMLLAWALRWFIASFDSDIPWMNCYNAWNTEACIQFDSQGGNTSMRNISEQVTGSSEVQSSVEEYWRRHILELSSGVEELGGIKWDIFGCLTLIWVLAYFAIWKGIEWTSKVVYVTATLPMFMLIVVLIRGVTLEGAGEGIRVFLQPNITKLADIELWTDAASQVLYSFGTATGAITTLCSHNKFHRDFVRDAAVLVGANALASFLSGFAIFSVLGFLALAKGTTVSEVAESGPGLIYVVYPTALSLLPLAQFWCAFSFFTIILMGFDSLDLFPKLFVRRYSYEIILAVVSALLFIAGIPMATRGGMYVLNIINTYSVSGWCLYFVAFSEYLAIAWCYGTSRMRNDIYRMTRHRVHRAILDACWKYIGPISAATLMIYSLSSYHPLKYDRGYTYPVWADVVGWITALSSITWIPATAAYVLWKAGGQTFCQKLRSSIEAKEDLAQQEEEKGEVLHALKQANV